MDLEFLYFMRISFCTLFIWVLAMGSYSTILICCQGKKRYFFAGALALLVPLFVVIFGYPRIFSTIDLPNISSTTLLHVVVQLFFLTSLASLSGRCFHQFAEEKRKSKKADTKPQTRLNARLQHMKITTFDPIPNALFDRLVPFSENINGANWQQLYEYVHELKKQYPGKSFSDTPYVYVDLNLKTTGVLFIEKESEELYFVHE